MNTHWKPGDVALVQNEYGVHNVAIYSVVPGGYVWKYGVADSTSPRNADARPLVVIDPEDTQQIRALANAWDDLADQHAALTDEPMTLSALRMQMALRGFARATPRIEEPTGLGAVVECDYDGKHGTAVNTGAGWTFYGEHLADHSADWFLFTSVRVLSEGVPA